MSYASDLGIKVGSKIIVIDPTALLLSYDYKNYNDGDVLELKTDDLSRTPEFYNLTNGGKFCYFTIQDRDDNITWKHYEEEKNMSKSKTLKFPCCVKTEDIVNLNTFDKILALFIANGAEVIEDDYGVIEDYLYFGADDDKETYFYDRYGSYTTFHPANVTEYTVEELLSICDDLNGVAVPQKQTLPVATVLLETNYKLIIKGYDINLTQQELNQLVDDLKGYQSNEQS